MTKKYSLAIVTISDRSAKGQREDMSGPKIEKIMNEAGYEIHSSHIVADEMDQITEKLIELSDQDVSLILTSGGTGFGPRDITPEATEKVCQRMTPGISEFLRNETSKYTKRSYLSRASSGIRDRTLIVNLPGSPKAVEENLEALLQILDHGLDMLAGEDH